MLASITPRCSMASDKSEPGTESVRLASDILHMARVISNFEASANGRRVKIQTVLDEILRGPLTERYRAVLAKLAEEVGPEPRSKPKKK